jgi:hypothetical protein
MRFQVDRWTDDAGEDVFAGGFGAAGAFVPPVPSQFGPAANDVQAAAQAQILQAEQYAQSHAQDALGQLAATAGITPNDLARATSAYNQYGAKAVSSLVSLASGQQAPTFSAFAPLIGFGLAIAGAVPVVGIMVTAALGVIDAVSQALNNALDGPACGNDPRRQWTLPGGMCLSRASGRPSGPDAPDWVGWPAFEATMLATPEQQANYQAWPPANIGGPTPVGKWSMSFTGITIDTAFPNYAETIGCELDALGPAPLFGQDTSVAGFFRTYYRALQHTYEFAINGYSIVDPWKVFASTQLTWNASHAGPSVDLVGTPYPSHIAAGACISSGAPNDPNGVSFIGALLNGDIDGVHHADNLPPLNVGPSTATANFSTIIARQPLSFGPHLGSIITQAKPGLSMKAIQAVGTKAAPPAATSAITKAVLGAGAAIVLVALLKPALLKGLPVLGKLARVGR